MRSWTEATRIGWPRRYGPGACLERIDPPAAGRAREHYACFEQFGGESQEYGRAVSLGSASPVAEAVIEQLQELHRNSVGYLRRDGLAAEDDQFYAEQNARLVANAEEYYRTMFSTRASSWNLRDTHMADTLRSLRPTSSATANGPSWWSGRTTPTSATPDAPRWAAGASSTWGS